MSHSETVFSNAEFFKTLGCDLKKISIADSLTPVGLRGLPWTSTFNLIYHYLLNMVPSLRNHDSRNSDHENYDCKLLRLDLGAQLLPTLFFRTSRMRENGEWEGWYQTSLSYYWFKMDCFECFPIKCNNWSKTLIYTPFLIFWVFFFHEWVLNCMKWFSWICWAHHLYFTHFISWCSEFIYTFSNVKLTLNFWIFCSLTWIFFVFSCISKYFCSQNQRQKS